MKNRERWVFRQVAYAGVEFSGPSLLDFYFREVNNWVREYGGVVLCAAVS